MNPAIFLDDFERTEHSDSLHAILGRALIIATRFDAMCKAAALQLNLSRVVFSLADEEHRSDLIDQLVKKYRVLSHSVGALQLPKDVSVLLYDAIEARNYVAHDLAKGMTGCLDTRIDESTLIREVSELTFDLAHGDVLISHFLGALNGEPSPNADFLSSSVDRVVRWVVDA